MSLRIYFLNVMFSNTFLVVWWRPGNLRLQASDFLKGFTHPKMAEAVVLAEVQKEVRELSRSVLTLQSKVQSMDRASPSPSVERPSIADQAFSRRSVVARAQSLGVQSRDCLCEEGRSYARPLSPIENLARTLRGQC